MTHINLTIVVPSADYLGEPKKLPLRVVTVPLPGEKLTLRGTNMPDIDYAVTERSWAIIDGELCCTIVLEDASNLEAYQ